MLLTELWWAKYLCSIFTTNAFRGNCGFLRLVCDSTVIIILPQIGPMADLVPNKQFEHGLRMT